MCDVSSRWKVYFCPSNFSPHEVSYIMPFKRSRNYKHAAAQFRGYKFINQIPKGKDTQTRLALLHWTNWSLSQPGLSSGSPFTSIYQWWIKYQLQQRKTEPDLHKRHYSPCPGSSTLKKNGFFGKPSSCGTVFPKRTRISKCSHRPNLP